MIFKEPRHLGLKFTRVGMKNSAFIAGGICDGAGAMNEEVMLWKGSPSQWLNLWPFVFGFAVCVAIVIFSIGFPPALVGLLLPLATMVWSYLSVRTRVFELTTQRLRTTHGIINQVIDEIELYRVKDIQMHRTWWMRLTGLATVRLETSDRGLATLEIPAIPSGVELREQLRKQVELMRDQKRVREMDFEDSANSDGPV